MVSIIDYKEFKTEDESKEWVELNFGKWLKDIQKDRYSYFGENLDIADLLYSYSGNNSYMYNPMLRGWREYDKELAKKYNNEIDIINKSISNFQLKDNIVVWRFFNKKLLKFLCEEYRLTVNNTFTDKAGTVDSFV